MIISNRLVLSYELRHTLRSQIAIFMRIRYLPSLPFSLQLRSLVFSLFYSVLRFQRASSSGWTSFSFCHDICVHIGRMGPSVEMKRGWYGGGMMFLSFLYPKVVDVVFSTCGGGHEKAPLLTFLPSSLLSGTA